MSVCSSPSTTLIRSSASSSAVWFCFPISFVVVKLFAFTNCRFFFLIIIIVCFCFCLLFLLFFFLLTSVSLVVFFVSLSLHLSVHTIIQLLLMDLINK